MAAWLKAFAAVAMLALAGCRDAAGPCDRSGACEVQGVDLRVDLLEVVASQHDPETGFGIVDPDSIDLTFRVANHGDSVSTSTALTIRYVGKLSADERFDAAPPDTVIIPPLAPGYAHERHLTMRTYESATRPRQAGVWGDSAYAVAELLQTDRNDANNRRESPRVHIRLAVLDFAVMLLDTALQVNRSFPARLVIRNTSRHGALPPAAIGFWLWGVNVEVAGPMGFGSHDMPGLAPSAAYERDLVLKIPPNAVWNFRAEKYVLVTQVSDPGTGDSLLWRARQWVIGNGPEVTVRPDYTACQPPELKVDTIARAPLVCTNPYPFYVFELAPQTDREYSIEQPDHPGASIYRADGSKVGDVMPGWWFHFHVGGTYWVVDALLRDEATPTRSMTLRQRPLSHTDGMNGTAKGLAIPELHALGLSRVR